MTVPRAASRPTADTPIVLFDGVCNLCNRWVDFVLRHDREGVTRFAPLQSEVADRLLNDAGLVGPPGDTVVLLDGSGLWTRSAAALRILRLLGPPYRYLYGLVAVPRPIRDWVYDRVAERRYRWFGRREACRMPRPEDSERFL